MKLLDLARFSLWSLQQRRVLALSPERVQERQARRLRRLLHAVVQRSSFYRDKYRDLDLARCSLADLPTTNKGEIMAHFDEVVTDPRVRRADIERYMLDPDNADRLYQNKYAVCSTSGSQGPPLIVVQDSFSMWVLFALQLTRANIRRPGPLEAIRRLREPGRIAVIALRRGFFPSNAIWQHVPAPARAYVQLLRVTPTDPDLIDLLNRFRPHALTAYASILELLALQKDRLRLAPELRQVVSNSELLTDRAYAAFRDAFGVPVLNNYSMAECNHLSNGCLAGPGVHINADWAILEVVNERNQPVAPGQAGAKVLLTNLANQIQPFIRYEIGDRVTMATTACGCGNLLPRIERLEGRTADFFWIGADDGYRQLLYFVFKTALEMVPEIREWQAIQEERNRILVRLEVLPGAALERSRPWQLLQDQLDSLGLSDAVHLEVQFVPRLEPDPVTGKFRRMVSQVGPPSDLAQSFKSGAGAQAMRALVSAR
jgi:phenylacetate-CoA ligase